MPSKKGTKTRYPEKGSTRRGISYDEGKTYSKVTGYSPSDLPIGSGSAEGAAEILRRRKNQSTDSNNY